jgi:hypothetical protein
VGEGGRADDGAGQAPYSQPLLTTVGRCNAMSLATAGGSDGEAVDGDPPGDAGEAGAGSE